LIFDYLTLWRVFDGDVIDGVKMEVATKF